MSESENIEPESLRVQLSELNNRSRWYTAQLWHIPFAYLGVLIIAIGQVVDKKPLYLPHVLLLGAFFGVCVLCNMWGLLDGIKRAVVFTVGGGWVA